MATPTNLTELKAARAAAGTRYAAAIAELEASYIELASFDRALNNANVIKMTAHPTGYPTFAEFPEVADNIPRPLRHPQFGTYSNDWRGSITSATEQLIRTLSN